ncbi:MAG: hypothetical protein ACOCSD_06235 [Halolamina sp.]
MDVQRWWHPFVEVVTVLWIALFGVDVAVSADLLALLDAFVVQLRRGLRWLLVVFVVDLGLLYRWSAQGPGRSSARTGS